MKTVFTGNVLIVEDNVIIAMDAEELLYELGAQSVHIASDADKALSLIGAHEFMAAILDFNLDNETSEPVADALAERGIPFVFATGYGDPTLLPERYQSLPLLGKPYSGEEIRNAFEPLPGFGPDA